MARTTIGGWFKQTFGGGAQKSGGVGTQSIGKKVVTSDGVALGTISELWRGADAADHAPHDDTFGVGGGADRLYIPTNAVARTTDQELHLTVAMAQVTARGWRYRPEWLPGDAAGTTPSA
jgi:hypothetical protein